MLGEASAASVFTGGTDGVSVGSSGTRVLVGVAEAGEAGVMVAEGTGLASAVWVAQMGIFKAVFAA